MSNGPADVWNAVSWVGQLQDPSLHLDALHDAFERVVFGLEVADDDAESSSEISDEGSDDMDDDMADALKELEGDGDEKMEDDEGSDAFENISEEEEREREERNRANEFVAGDWQDWLMGRRRPKDTTADPRSLPPNERGVEVELERVGLGQRDLLVKNDILPERYKVIAVEEMRDMLGPKNVTDTVGSSIDLSQEAVWILHQLRRPGQPFARSEVAAEVAAKPFDRLLTDPLTCAIAYALEKMTKNFLEPAHLMMYHQTPLMPLVFALWHHSASFSQFCSETVNPSFAYCTETGRRQRPTLKSNTVSFELFGQEGAGQQRKPCLLELGRLLYCILDLDILCHRLEHTRQVLLMSLHNHLEPSRLLAERVFDHKTEADMWSSYTTFLIDLDTSIGRSATHRIKSLDLGLIFEEYSITAAQYHDNLAQGTGTYTCKLHREDVHSWAHEQSQSIGFSDGEQLIDLFNRSIAEQFSKLPILRKRVFDAFCTDGEVLVTSLSSAAKSVTSMTVSTLLAENTQLFFDLLQQERNGSIQLDLVLDERVVRNILNVHRLYDSVEDTWSRTRSKAIDATIGQLMRSCRRDVRSALRNAGEASGQRIACARLSNLCSEGPFAATRLPIEGVEQSRRTWDGTWNTVESLPIHPKQLPDRARVCAVFRGENGIICFACIDTNGSVCGFTRWTGDVTVGSEAGNAAHAVNLHNLQTMLEEHFPAVIAIAAQKQASNLFRMLESFIERQESDDLARIPVVWASPSVAIAYTHSASADSEMSMRDPVSRSCVSLARYVQDPLLELCQLFDAKQSVLLLPLGAHPTVSKSKMFRALSAEMTLWIAAIGINLADAICWSNPKSVFQFLCGFGPLRAAALVDLLRQKIVLSRSEVSHLLSSHFGDHVAVNAQASLRITMDSTDDAKEAAHHVLDCTLLPPAWYDAANVVVMSAYPSESNKLSMRLIFQQDVAERRFAFGNANVSLIVAQIRDCFPECQHFGVAEVHLIMDEIIANGNSYARRPYRLITTRELFRLLTGVVIASDRDSVCAADESVTLRIGDIVQGTIAGARLGHSDNGSPDGLRVVTSHGISGFMSGTSIADQSILKELADHRIAFEEGKRVLFSAVGKIVYGLIAGCNWDRCELRLAWTSPPAVTPSATNIHINNTRHALDNRSANSVLTRDILDAAAVNSMKISRHALFKNVTRHRAVELLQDKLIGECLIRGSSRKNYATICVKIGLRMVANWPVKETRNSAGHIRYILDHRRIGGKHQFEEMDQCLEQFIRPTIDIVKGLRSHRKFVADPRDLVPRLEEESSRSGGFAYAFTEGNDDESPPTFYKVHYRIGGRDKSLKLHVDCDSLYVRFPDRNGGSEWLACHNAEIISIALKNWIAEVMRSQ